MPDLITHALTGHITARGLGVRRATVLLVIGNCLPDLLSRLPVRIIGELNYRTGWFSDSFWYWMWVPLHLPVGLLVACYVIAHLFVEERRVAAFAALLGGSATHLLLDSLQWHASGGDPILWPFTWQGYEFGLVSPEASLSWIPWLAGVSAVAEIAYQSWRALRTRSVAKLTRPETETPAETRSRRT